MSSSANNEQLQGDHGVDLSSPEGMAAMAYALELVSEIRETLPSSTRRLQLYERSLGLAVIPTLLRRAAIAVLRRAKRWRRR